MNKLLYVMQLYLLTQFAYSGLKLVLSLLLSSASIYSSIMTVIINNPVFSVLFLIGLFVVIGLYFIAMGIEFIGIAYLLVYVGAISILFLFILMLINVRISELLTEGINSAGLGIIIIVTFSSSLGNVLPYYLQISDAFSNYLIYIKTILTNITSAILAGSPLKGDLLEDIASNIANTNGNTWDGSLLNINHISSIGNILYSSLYILLIIISLVLLLAMVGAIVVTLKRNTSLKQVNLNSDAFSCTSVIDIYTHLQGIFYLQVIVDHIDSFLSYLQKIVNSLNTIFSCLQGVFYYLNLFFGCLQGIVDYIILFFSYIQWTVDYIILYFSSTQWTVDYLIVFFSYIQWIVDYMIFSFDYLQETVNNTILLFNNNLGSQEPKLHGWPTWIKGPGPAPGPGEIVITTDWTVESIPMPKPPTPPATPPSGGSGGSGQ